MALPVGIPKEIKIGERRVSLTPKGVVLLVKYGIQVYVEQGAGLLSGFQDGDYKKAGANLISDRTELWRRASLIKKVKEPVPEEFPFFRLQHIIFTYLHLASPSARPLIDALLSAKASAIAYETIEKNGTTPLLSPMSEIAGVLSAYFVGIFRNHIEIKNNEIYGIEKAKSKMIELASEYPHVPKKLLPGQVIILGGGYVGKNAAQMLASMGGTVFLSELSEDKRRQLKDDFKSKGLAIHLINPKEKASYEDVLASSEVIVGAVHAAGKRAPIVIDSLLLQKISKPKRKIILDIAIDQGGNIAESSPTDYDHPLSVDSCGNLRFSVTNIPSLCGRGASEALEEVSLDYTIALAQGVSMAPEQCPELKSGINILNGKLVHKAVCEAHGFPKPR